MHFFVLSYHSPKGSAPDAAREVQQKGVFSNDENESHRYGSCGCGGRSIDGTLTLVSMATGHLYFATKAMAFVMPVLAFVELDVLCKLL